jgi:hypothetical protein
MRIAHRLHRVASGYLDAAVVAQGEAVAGADGLAAAQSEVAAD